MVFIFLLLIWFMILCFFIIDYNQTQKRFHQIQKSMKLEEELEKLNNLIDYHSKKIEEISRKNYKKFDNTN